MDSAKRVMSGTKGQLWLDGELVAEAYKFQAKVDLERKEVRMCGIMWKDEKLMGMDGKGSVGLHKVNSRMIAKLGKDISEGKDPRFVFISKLDDPDAYGAERVAIKNVRFNDLTLADWQAGEIGSVEAPFSFSGFELLDRTDA